MDSLSQKIVENARKRREKMLLNKENSQNEKENAISVISPLIQKFESGAIKSPEKTKTTIRTPDILSIRERIECIKNSQHGVQSPESNYASIKRKTSSQFNTATVGSDNFQPKDYEKADNAKIVSNSLTKSESGPALSKHSDTEYRTSLSRSVSSISLESVNKLYPHVSDHSESTIDSSFIEAITERSENIDSQRHLPKPHLGKDPNEESDIRLSILFPSTPNTPKMIVCEDNCFEVKINTEKIGSSCPGSVMAENISEKSKAKTDTHKGLSKQVAFKKKDPDIDEIRSDEVMVSANREEGLKPGSQISIISNDGCLLHNEAYTNEVVSQIKKNISENETIIRQTSQALNMSYSKSKKKQLLTPQAVEAERLLLLATHKHSFYQEFEKKITSKVFPCKCNSKSSTYHFFVNVNIKDMGLYLKSEWIHGSQSELNNFYFCFLVSHGHTIYCTHAVGVNDADSNLIKFKNNFRFSAIESTDNIRIQLYVLVQDSECRRPSTGLKFKIGHLNFTPKRISTLAKRSNNTTPRSVDNLSIISRSSNFVYVGEVNMPLDKYSYQKMSLNNIVFDCPITGVFTANVEVQPITTCLAKGFLTYLSQYGGMYTWQRYWCGLYKDELSFWAYPQDESTKPPIKKIHLKWAQSQDCLQSVPIDECSRPNTFEIKLMELDSNKACQFSNVRHVFSADSSDEKIHWIESLKAHSRKSQRGNFQTLDSI